MRSMWSDEGMLEERRQGESPRGRNEDSSVDAQYEDQVAPERTWERDVARDEIS